MKTIQIISPFSENEPVHRMKIQGIQNSLSKKYSFSLFPQNNQDPNGVIINCLHLDWINNIDFKIRLDYLKRKSLIMLFLADFYPESINKIKLWDQYVDFYVVPTKGLKGFVEIFTTKKVEVVNDPIDFCVTMPINPVYKQGQNIKVVWFGFPESYDASLRYFENVFNEIRDVAEFNIITDISSFKSDVGLLHHYDPANFLDKLKQFDVCLLSHHPINFFVGNLFKSENKAILAISQGLPVIASDTPAYRHLLEGCGLSDYLFTNKQKLREKIINLSDFTNRVSYLDKAVPYVMQNYGIKSIANQWDDLFRKEYFYKFGDSL